MKYNPRIVRAYWVEQGIPLPVEEFVFAPPRKFRWDWAWVGAQVAVEVEGGIFTRQAHGSVGGILRDIEKHNLATVNGWRFLRVLPADLCTEATCAMIRSLLKL